MRGETRFGLGGPADLVVDAYSEAGFLAALARIPPPRQILGGGTNLIVSDDGYRGSVLRYRAFATAQVRLAPDSTLLIVDSGVELDSLVEYTVRHGLAGMEALRRIPGWVGAAIYGNAGAYGQQISDHLVSVRIFDGVRIREISAADCGFVYRGSAFKQRKEWIILSATFKLAPGDPHELAARAESIRQTRDAKFPPTMKCAGSIFKNLHAANLPQAVVAALPPGAIQYGKVPAAWFLEQIGAKGRSNGGIHVAAYHANLVFNDGQGTSGELIALIDQLKAEVQAAYGFSLEEEVQFVGFPTRKSF